MKKSRLHIVLSPVLFGLAFGALSPGTQAAPPAVGDKAKDFTLETIDGAKVRLYDLTAQGPVVLIVLRGYPGYQCPFCTKQVAELVSRAKDLTDTGARVLLVYPGPGPNLHQRAQEFLKNATLPEKFALVIDQDYAFTNAYDLRWDAPKETAYPSTFVLDRDGIIRFAKIGKEHGGRSMVAEVLSALPKPAAR